MEILEMVWQLANEPAGLTVIVTVILFVLNKVYSKHPAVRKYEGYLIAGIKYAEKTIADDTENKALAKLDAALEYAIKLIETKERVEVGKKAKAALAAEISVLHDRIELS